MFDQHPESVRFNQVVVLADVRNRICAGSLREPMNCSGLHTSHIYFQFLTKRLRSVTPSSLSSAATITHTGLPLDAIEGALQRSVAMRKMPAAFWVCKHQKMTGRPVTPLHKSTCSGGGLQRDARNGFFGEGEHATC